MKTLFILCGCLCVLHPAFAWDAEGHMIVTHIAYNHLDPEVKAKCDALIAVSLAPYNSSATSNFITAAVWADDFKSSLGTGPDHYINIPISLDGYPTNNFTIDPTNVVAAIRRYIITLQNPASSLTDQATALRYLLHYVGDIQQPLHCSTGISTNRTNGDAGGNSFFIDGGWGNLHTLWDDGGGYLTDFISRPLDAGGEATLSNKAAAVEAAYPYAYSVGTIPDPMDWANEGVALSKSVCYSNITANTTPSASYLNTAQATTEQRIAMGGQRLAKLLSTIFVTNAPTAFATKIATGNFTFSWGAVSGRVYRVQCKQQLSDNVWSNLTDIVATTTSLSFTNAATQSRQFYRAIVVN